MKNIFFALLFLITTPLLAQNYEKKWAKVAQYEDVDKAKSANAVVTKIYKKANRQANEAQIIKSFFYKSKYMQILEEDAQSKILDNLKLEINKASIPSKAILNLIYANCLETYLNKYSYDLSKRTRLDSIKSSNFLTWTQANFETEIQKALEQTLANESILKNTSLENYESIFDYPTLDKFKTQNLFTYLLTQNISYYKSNFYPSQNDLKNYEKMKKEFLGSSEDFKKKNLDLIKNSNQRKILSYYQKLEENNSKEYQFERICYYRDLISNPTSEYLEALNALQKKTTDKELLQKILLEKANTFNKEASKKLHPDYNIKAIEALDSIIQFKNNTNSYYSALEEKQAILSKSLNIQLQKYTYPNENTRAFITYKNLDAITISFYKITKNQITEFDNKNKENKNISLVTTFISKNKAEKSNIYLLKEKDYFDHTTEVLLPQLETGNYLVYFESDNLDKTKKGYNYETITVSNLMLLTDFKDNKEIYQVLNRKTGKPIENATLKSNAFETKTNKEGIATTSLGIDNKYYNDFDLQITTEKDTLSLNSTFFFNFNRYAQNEDSDTRIKAKANFYLDRAIYRPGQTVYYKGIVIQNKNEKTKIVPNLLIKIIVKDANRQDLKEFEVTTNEFGSFSGEFILPKNGMTGDFSMYAEEPVDLEKDPLYDKKKDEHPFWDNCDDFDDSRIYFKVEEYKRPKFEIAFEKVKENFVVDQKISVKGFAKSFAGSTISDAKISYTIQRDTYNFNASHYPEATDTITTGESKTDAFGKFTIEFDAKPNEKADKEKLPIFRYRIIVNVTDINGETRSNVTNVKVGYHSLILQADIPKIITAENSEKIQLTSTNLNNQFTPITGDLKIYFIREYSKKVKERVFQNPEIETISKKEFNTLFPYENNEPPISETDKGELIFSKKVNTETDKEIPLNFTKNYKHGYYKLVFSAADKQNNLIESNTLFEVNQNNGLFQENKLLIIEQLNNDVIKDGFVTLKLTSSIPELYINAAGNYKDAVFFDQNISLNNNQAILKIPIKNKSINAIKISFQSIFENQVFNQEYSVIYKTIEQKLEFETESLRSKIEPGNKEFWSFKLKSKNTSTNAEILASMYDSSLDLFTVNNWQKLSLDNHYDNVVDYKQTFGFENLNSDVLDLNHFINQTEFKNEETELLWFGFNFTEKENSLRAIKEKLKKKPLNSRNISGIITDGAGPLPGVNVVVKGTQRGTQTDFDGSYEIEASYGEELVFSFMGMNDQTVRATSNRINCKMNDESKMLETVVITSLGISKTPKSLAQISPSEIVDNTIAIRGTTLIKNNEKALILINGVISTAETFSKISPENLVSATLLKGSEAIALYGKQATNGVIIITTKKGIEELIQVKARSNLSETAFFFPHLKTDKTGNISFNFTSPEALTSWKMRLFGHNKEAVAGYLEKTIVTQKSLMIMPNFPRFLREKDTLFVSAKVANLTSETKAGMAVLQLFDATTMENIDVKMMNSNSIKNFTIAPTGNTVVTWKIAIPEGLQGVQYKILAKSGNFSDGEENILPVLTNNILVTEGIPVWVRENTKKEYTFENLKNNQSSTLRNHQFTFEYTSNPAWLAIQSLPYLMEYEHECAEQTFARFYANALASEIINSNPKIAAVFESWKKNGKLNSKLEENEELKSILIAETPWLLDAQNEDERKKNTALLFDLDKMKNSQEQIFTKLTQKQKPSGGFAWFDGGNESEYITRHILAGLGHLQKLIKSDDLKEKASEITQNGIPFIDNSFLNTYNSRIKELNNQNKIIWLNLDSELHYLYTRSFYLEEYPLSEELKKATAVYLENIKTNWVNYTLYEKGMAALVLNRFDEKATAKKIIEGLKETSSNNEDWGMYWIANKSGWYWYQAPIETQALLIEAFAEVNNDTKSVDAMKVWLLKNKQTKNWPTTKSTTEAIYALLLQGTDWLSVKDNTVIKIGDTKIMTKKMSENQKEAETGYLKLTWKADEIKKEMASIKVENKSKVPGFGGIYWQYFEDLDKIKNNNDGSLSISKELYIKTNTSKGEELKKIMSKNPLNIGDLVTVRLIINTKEDMEFVHLKDMRASCFEPISVLSQYKYTNNLGYYMSTKDTATHFFFDSIEKGTYVIEYDIRVNNAGDFSNGITTIQSMYAPEYSSHTKGIRVTTKN